MAAREFHERTKHTPASVHASRHFLDWENRPSPLKEYVGLADEPVPPELERLLRLGAGIVRSRELPGGDVYHFRTYSSAGALYPVEVYVAAENGLSHFDPSTFAMQPLRDEGAESPFLVLTGILWRTAWKYEARGWRHLYWDAGTMLANLLALAPPARIYIDFDDDAVNRLVGVDGEREAALALLSLDGSPPTVPENAATLELETRPLSPREVAYPDAHETQRATAARLRETDGETRNGFALDDPEPVLRRRGSIRDFVLQPIEREQLAGILAGAMSPIPADASPVNELALVVNAVDGLEPGAYRFQPPDGFDLIRTGAFRWDAGYLCLEQPLGARAAATLFFLADLDGVLDRFGERGYRWALLESGVRTGRVYLGAFARGLGATATTFYDDEVSRFVGTRSTPMLAAAVGHKP